MPGISPGAGYRINRAASANHITGMVMANKERKWDGNKRWPDVCQLSTLQQIGREPYVRDPEMPGKSRVLLGDCLVHLPSHAPIGEMAGRSGAQFCDIQGLREIHLEERAISRTQGKRVTGLFRKPGLRERVERRMSLPHGFLILRAESSLG